jgi:hypothetical protein
VQGMMGGPNCRLVPLFARTSPLTQTMGMAFSTDVNNVGWLSVLPWLALLLAVVLYLREGHLYEHLLRVERSW